MYHLVKYYILSNQCPYDKGTYFNHTKTVFLREISKWPVSFFPLQTGEMEARLAFTTDFSSRVTYALTCTHSIPPYNLLSVPTIPHLRHQCCILKCAVLAHLPEVLPHIPKYFLEEMQGVADGAEVPFQKILMMRLKR